MAAHFTLKIAPIAPTAKPVRIQSKSSALVITKSIRLVLTSDQSLKVSIRPGSEPGDEANRLLEDIVVRV